MASISFFALRVASELTTARPVEEHLFVSWLDDRPPAADVGPSTRSVSRDQARTTLMATTTDETSDPQSGAMSGPTYAGRGSASDLQRQFRHPLPRQSPGLVVDDFGHAVSELRILGATPPALVEALTARGIGVGAPLPNPTSVPGASACTSR